jgi:alpha-beta hydrolase superfamily lysophospholipase
MRLSSKLVWSAAAALLATFAVAGCASIDRWQREAIFRTDVAARVEGREAPDDAEQYDLPLPGGGETGADSLRFWYLPAAQPDAPTVLYLHGARRNLYDNAGRIERLRALGLNVLALDYRGFGRSTHILPTEASAIEDARLAFAELERRQPDPARRLLYGYSLGGAVAIALAQQVDGVAAVVLEATFTRIADVVRERRWLPFVNLAVTQKFDSLTRIAAVNEPLLFLHGTSDRVVPHTMSDRLYAAARAVPPERKRVVKIDGASHWGVMSLDPATFGRTLAEFVALATGSAASQSSPAAAGASAGLP